MFKRCSHCKKEKPLEEFAKKDKTGHQARYCRRCMNRISHDGLLKRGEKNRQLLKEIRKGLRDVP